MPSLSLIPTFIILVSLFTSCPGQSLNPFKPLFPIPPGVLTIEGEDLAGPPPVLPVADIYWSQTLSEKGYAQDSRHQLSLPLPAGFYQFSKAVELAPGD
jgi:hypothetical protein